MSKIIYLILYILQYIIFTNGQNVQTMRPQDTCVPSILTLACPINYIVIVRTASHGVAQIAGSCAYKPGDCIVDGMSIVTCLSDSTQCSIYATTEKLSQCNDQYSSYFHVEYDCVPISMTDTSKEYNICQNGIEITSDHGILRSPGYPSQFQTTSSECFRAIHLPHDKIIHLWLTDLSIGSTSTTCANDHVYVVDNVQTYKHCGTKRYAYPYLCSSTIIIQYLVKTQSVMFRGMRMYFEIVDRPVNDNCPQITVTPIPSITPTVTTHVPSSSTNTPIYVILGIASPTRSFQICAGEFYSIECSNDYAIAVTTNIFGVTLSNQCELHDADKHCVITTDPTFLCRQQCTYMYPGNQIIPTCNNQNAAYQYVEYQCIPTKTSLVSTNTLCSNDGSKTSIQIDRNGRFQSYNYPNLKQINCTYRLKTKPGYIMHIYALDISLNNYNPACKANRMTLIEDNDDRGLDFCEQRTYSLIYSSCSNEIDLRYIITDDTQQFSYGLELYIESQARPFDWCGGVLPTSTYPTTVRSTPSTPKATPVTSVSFVSALDPVEYNICYGDALNYACPYAYTFMTLDAYYGVRSNASNKCEFLQGDCVQEATATITLCQNDSPNCYLAYTSKRRLAHCYDKYADYLHVTYQCVPSFPTESTSSLQVYDICETSNSIADTNGVVISPDFPKYIQTNDECRRDIIGVQDRVLKIWLNEMDLSSGGQRSSNDEPDFIINNTDDIEPMYPLFRDTCIDDYLIINSPHLSYVYCGKRKLSLEPICATSVRIQYKTTSAPNLFYKGFKFYFEWIEKPMDIFCVGTPPTIDPSATTTTSPGEPLPIWAQNLDVSPTLSTYVCLGTIDMLKCPRSNDYVVSIMNSNYGVTGTGLCEVPTSSHCYQEASLSLTCTHSCFLEYMFPKPLSQCGNQNADYMKIDYKCIPIRLPDSENPIDICASTTTETIAIDKGMITSPRYPSLILTSRCSKKLETLPNKLWMIYIVDLFLEAEDAYGDCIDASFTIYDGNDKLIICGLQQPGLVLMSCSNIVQFNFISSHLALGYRGFKVFFQTVDIPDGWSCKPNNFTTTPITTEQTTTRILPPTSTEQTTTRTLSPTTSIPPSLQIAVYGGTTTAGIRQYCQFPFTYEGNQYSKCISDKSPNTIPVQNLTDPWCSLTSNFDTDRQWGFCDIGVTDSTLYDICRSQTQTLRCSPGYVIDIITADYAAKTNGNIGPNSCIYDRNDCFQSDASTIENVCAGKTSCIAYHFVKTLVSCQNRPSAYLHIDYTCVPNDLQTINTYDICDNNFKPQDNIRRGFLISPSFPNLQNNIDCTYDLQILKPHQDIYFYIVDMDLNSPNLIGQSCTKDRLIIRSDDSYTEWCGRSYTNLLLKTCHTSVSIQLIRASDAKGRGVKFYFEFRERSPNEICEDIITPSTRPTLLPTSVRPTTVPSLPNYFPDPSPRMLKTLCYPDLSALFGTNNFQCPSDYVIVIHRAFVGKGNQCDYTPGDCISEADYVYRTCSGKQACAVSFLNIFTLPECNNSIANYLFVQYQCLPTLSIVQNIDDLCTSQVHQISGISGILKSPSYPTYTQTQCSNVTLSSPEGSDLVLYMYVLDFDIGSLDLNTGNCSNDYLLLSYQCNNQIYNEYLCGTRQTELLFDTCSPTDKIFASYNLTNSNAQNQRGFALLYHFLPKSTATTLPPIPTTTTGTIKSSTTTTSPWIGPGPVSTTMLQSTVCVQTPMQLQCNSDYGLVLHEIDLAVSRTGRCTYSPDDCFEERTYLHGTCGGKSSCYIFPPLISLPKCNNSKSTYFYAEYQCIPTRPKLNINICSPSNPLERVEGGAIISSLGYTSENKECKLIVQSANLLENPAHKAFAVYIVMIDFPIRTIREQGLLCNDYDPYIEIEDSQIGTTRLCGNSHTRKLFETCSNTIEIRYKNFNIPRNNTQFKGFQLYFESIEKKECSDIVTSIPPKVREPFVIADEFVCASLIGRERVSFSCTSDHGLVFLQSYEFVTKNPQSCDITQQICHYLSEQPQALCSGQQSCTYIHSIPIGPSLNVCDGDKGDSLQFFYQCIPMKPTGAYPKATFCSDTHITFDRGFIETPGYPNSYEIAHHQCSLRISIPNTSEGKQLSIFLYIIDLSIRDTSTIDSTSAIECFDSITYRDGKTTRSLCGNIDQPILEYQTDKDELELTLNITESLPSNISKNWHGARFFFLIGNQSLSSPPTNPASTTTTTTTTQITTTTTTQITTTTTEPTVGASTEHTDHKSNHGPTIAGVVIAVIAVILLGVFGFIAYRRRLRLKAIETPKVVYRRGVDTVNGEGNNGFNEKRSSIPPAALRGPAVSTFTIKTYHEQIEIKDGSIGNSYEKIFKRFFDDTVTQITIQDPYIRAFHQISNFLRFCEVMIKSSAKIKRIDLITTTETNEQAKQMQIDQLNQFKEHLAKKHSIELTIQYLTGLHDREIRLNNGWIIKIGRGLDFYKPPECKLSIGYYDLDLRPCQQTTIDIFHTERVYSSSS